MPRQFFFTDRCHNRVADRTASVMLTISISAKNFQSSKGVDALAPLGSAQHGL